MKLASRLDAIRESATLAIAARAAELRAAGQDVLSLAAGEPDFAPPEPVREAAKAWIDGRNGRYTPTSGLAPVREAFAQDAARKRGLDLDSSNVLVCAGTKPAIYVGLMTLLEPGDEVVILAPYWVSYPDLVRLAGGEPRILAARPDTGFVHDPEDVEAALARPRCRALILNSPNNPTGRVLPHAEIECYHELAKRHDVTILSDEIYSTLTYGVESVSPAVLDPRLETTLVFDGLSKSHAIPGWRIGCMIGPSEVVAAAGRIQSQLLGNASSVSQHAAAVAFRAETERETATMVDEFARRRDLIVREIATLDGFSLHEPAGAFYALPHVKPVLDRFGIDDIELAGRILDETRVALVPGSAFGAPDHLRFSFATRVEDIAEAFDRLRTWLSEPRDP